MNHEQRTGRRDPLVSQDRRTCGASADDDVPKAAGSADQRLDVLETGFGDTPARIKVRIDARHRR